MRRRRPTSTLKTVVMAAPLMVIAAVLMVVFVLRLAQSPDAKVQLGDEVFGVGQVRRLAPLVDRDGPLLFQDLLGRDRDLFVQHLGDDATKGWVAFEAHAPGQPRTCHLVWRQARGVFEDQCSKATFPPEGTGLTHYATEVKPDDNGDLTLYVDLNKRVVD